MGTFKQLFKGVATFFTDILETTLVALAIFAVVYSFLIQPYRVKGDSMDPSLYHGQLILTDKLSYRFSKPQRGDVITFKYPNAPSYEYIKRIIGLPGEELEIRDGLVYIYNEDHPGGLALDELYLVEGALTMGQRAILGNARVSIPLDKYVVMGDNRGRSSDSRNWGFVPRKNIVGRAWIIYWPPESLDVVARADYSE